MFGRIHHLVKPCGPGLLLGIVKTLKGFKEKKMKVSSILYTLPPLFIFANTAKLFEDYNISSTASTFFFQNIPQSSDIWGFRPGLSNETAPTKSMKTHCCQTQLILFILYAIIPQQHSTLNPSFLLPLAVIAPHFARFYPVCWFFSPCPPFMFSTFFLTSFLFSCYPLSVDNLLLSSHL